MPALGVAAGLVGEEEQEGQPLQRAMEIAARETSPKRNVGRD